MKPEHTQVGGQLGNRHRHFVGADRALGFTFEKEHTALLQIGREQVESPHEVLEMLVVAALFDFFA